MTQAIVTCADCGQKNRLPAIIDIPGKVIICGRCKEPLDLDEDAADDDDEDGQ
jgi:transposase